MNQTLKMIDQSKLTAFRRQAKSYRIRLFLLFKLPLAFIAGVKIKELTEQGATTQMKFAWINQNPFRSMYFAAMQMGAELSTGLLLYQYLQSGLDFSMLLTKVEANYSKKAVGTISFKCTDGALVEDKILKLNDTESLELRLKVIAVNSQSEHVADFVFTWSIKNRPKH